MLGRTHVVFVVCLKCRQSSECLSVGHWWPVWKNYTLYLRALVLHHESNLEQKYQPNVMSALERRERAQGWTELAGEPSWTAATVLEANPHSAGSLQTFTCVENLGSEDCAESQSLSCRTHVPGNPDASWETGSPGCHTRLETRSATDREGPRASGSKSPVIRPLCCRYILCWMLSFFGKTENLAENMLSLQGFHGTQQPVLPGGPSHTPVSVPCCRDTGEGQVWNSTKLTCGCLHETQMCPTHKCFRKSGRTAKIHPVPFLHWPHLLVLFIKHCSPNSYMASHFK